MELSSVEPSVETQPSWLNLRGGWPEYIWGFVILLLSFGVFGPGRPQPADFVMVGLLSLPIALYRPRLPPEIAPPVLWLAGFVLYVAACNFVWAAITAEFDFFKSTAFYVFNFTVFLGYLTMLGERGDDWLRWSLYGFMATIVMLAVLSVPFASRAESGRLELFFANTNQLAYHVLLSASIVVLLAPRYQVPRWLLYGLLLCAMYLELRTYSRAGILGVLVLAALQFAQRPTLVTILALPVLGIALYLDLQALDADLMQHRLRTVEEGGTTEYLTDRGLDRLLDYPRYLFAGAGEGFLIRFHHLKQEIHSSFANMLFSYGVLGTSLFLVFVRALTKTAGTRATLLMVPCLAYSLFHHGMRARPFWILLAIALGVGVLNRVEASRKQSSELI